LEFVCWKMFSRAFFVVAAVAVCLAHAEISTYVPAVLYKSGMVSKGLSKAPLKAASNEPMNLLTELSGEGLKKDEFAVFILDKRGLNAKMLSEMSETFLGEMPVVSAEAAYTNGVDISAFTNTFGCDDKAKDSISEFGMFLDDDANKGKSVAICVTGEKGILEAYHTIAATRPDSVIVLTGPTTLRDDEPSDNTTLWPASVVETMVTFVAMSIPLILCFHLLCSIRPVEDVEYPKHKVSS